MMRVTSLLTLALFVGAGCTADAAPPASPYPAPAIGKAAPEFKAVDTNGKAHSLSQYRGKWVVLEWLNYDCPYVKKHYNSSTMQALQKKYVDKGVVWLAIVSSAKGKQGNYPPDEMNALTKEKGASPTAVLLDEAGTVGGMYDARTTPHMFVINPQGTLMYMGGIDDKPTARAADLQGARPHVDIALQEAMAGKPVSVPTSQPYGCNVKY
ncbi:MAG TPA: thioredoxin family protein [Thermoanaerobaculia bacterium]